MTDTRNEAFRSALRDSRLPGYLHGGLARWVEEGILPGSFLQSVLCNDLRLTVRRADDIIVSRIFEVVRFLEAHAPEACWGSPERVKNWPMYRRALVRQSIDELVEKAHDFR